MICKQKETKAALKAKLLDAKRERSKSRKLRVKGEGSSHEKKQPTPTNQGKTRKSVSFAWVDPSGFADITTSFFWTSTSFDMLHSECRGFFTPRTLPCRWIYKIVPTCPHQPSSVNLPWGFGSKVSILPCKFLWIRIIVYSRKIVWYVFRFAQPRPAQT